MELERCFPVWSKLTPRQQETLSGAALDRTVPKGSVIHRDHLECTGLMLVGSGQLRAYILSEDGREVTIYRLLDGDVCLFSASCILHNIQFDVSIEAEKDTQVLVIPPEVYRALMEESAPVANYTNDLMSSRFSEVMWRIEQIMWKSFDRRLASFLLEESALEGTDTLSITHEKIAQHLGSAREVVTRMLRCFQQEGLVKLSRSRVELLDRKGLARLARSA
nr:Crp/Fnr family transcriptional regulator [uncultured Oscillibacter sp.]